MNAEEDLSQEEKKMFSKLSQEAPYSPALENNIVYQLRKAGLIREKGSKIKLALRWAAILIFSIVFFFAGVIYRSKSSEENYSYVFLLHNSEILSGNANDRFREYQEWREGVEQRGIAITGEKLSASITTLGNTEESASPVSGFFLLFARSDDEAFRLASESPHVKNGGCIEIRRIVHQ